MPPSRMAEFDLWSPHDERRELNRTSCPLTSKCVLWYVKNSMRGILLGEGGEGREAQQKEAALETHKQVAMLYTRNLSCYVSGRVGKSHH